MDSFVDEPLGARKRLSTAQNKLTSLNAQLETPGVSSDQLEELIRRKGELQAAIQDLRGQIAVQK